MKARRTTILSVISIVTSIQFAHAAPLDVLRGPFETLLSIFKDPSITLGFTIIFFFMLLYGIFAGALKFVPVFKSDKGLSRQGKVVGIALAGLSTASIFYFAQPKGPAAILDQVLAPFEIFGGLALAAIFAGITYFGIRGGDSNSRSLALTAGAAGFGLVIAGMILSYQRDNPLMAWGFLIMLLAMIFGLAFRIWGRRGDGDNTTSSQPTRDGTTQRTAGPDGTTTQGTPGGAETDRTRRRIASPTAILHTDTPPISGGDAPGNTEENDDNEEDNQ